MGVIFVTPLPSTFSIPRIRVQLQLASCNHQLTQLRCIFSFPFISPPNSTVLHALSSLIFFFLLPASEFRFLSVFVTCGVHIHFHVIFSLCIRLCCLWFVAFNVFSAMCLVVSTSWIFVDLSLCFNVSLSMLGLISCEAWVLQGR